MHPGHAELLTALLWEECAALPRARRAAWADALGERYEETRRAAEAAGAARTAGTWYTPAALVEQILDESLALRRGGRRGALPARACDPACGAGNFLVALAQRHRRQGSSPARIAQRVHGMDLDPFAVAIARTRLRAHVGGGAPLWERAVRAGDSLKAGAWQAGGYDLVAGNPPFLSQLARATARSGEERQVLRDRFDGAVARYADSASAFLMLGLELLAPGGVLALVQPLSVLAASDSAPVRRACDARAPMRALILPAAESFRAAVHTCVPMLRAAPATAREPVRLVRADGAVVPLPRAALERDGWAAALASARGVPAPTLPEDCGRLRDHAGATADFRQHFYALGRLVREEAAGSRARTALRVVTVGAIAPARCDWGARPIRLAGRRLERPVLDRAAAAADPVLGPWLRARAVPKVLLATQTRALEAFVDQTAAHLPSTPVLTVVPRRAAQLWRVAAALQAPSTAAVAWQRHAGAALTPGALRLSAAQVLELPTPPTDPACARAWTQGAQALRRWQSARTPALRARAREDFAAAMCRAYRVAPGAPRNALLAWWRTALGDEGVVGAPGAR
ncbi:MAG: N-6 DNA methylase [Phycisphaerales bacterium]